MPLELTSCWRLRHLNYVFAGSFVRHNFWLWAGFFFMFCLFTMTWPVRSLEAWHTILFYYVVWISWLMTLSMSFTTNPLWSKHAFFVGPLWIKRSDTSHCFVFVTWCQCFYFEHFIGCLNFFYFCWWPIYNFYCVGSSGKPAVQICSLSLLHVGIYIMAFQLVCLLFNKLLSGLYNSFWHGTHS